jgi:hypothetical protein
VAFRIVVVLVLDCGLGAINFNGHLLDRAEWQSPSPPKGMSESVPKRVSDFVPEGRCELGLGCYDQDD